MGPFLDLGPPCSWVPEGLGSPLRVNSSTLGKEREHPFSQLLWYSLAVFLES